MNFFKQVIYIQSLVLVLMLGKLMRKVCSMQFTVSLDVMNTNCECDSVCLFVCRCSWVRCALPNLSI